MPVDLAALGEGEALEQAQGGSDEPVDLVVARHVSERVGTAGVVGPVAVVNDAVNAVLDAHQPFPALVVDDRQGNLVAANAAIYRLVSDASPALLEPPVNAIRLTLHPDRLAPRIVNRSEWRAHLLDRLGREYASSAGEELATLREVRRSAMDTPETVSAVSGVFPDVRRRTTDLA